MKKNLLISISLITMFLANFNDCLAQFTVDPKHWMSLLPDETRICDLSIPCAHDAATHDTDWDMWQDQKYDERTLFDMGVRCFDMRLSKNNCYNHGASDGLGNDMNDYDEEQEDHMPTLDQLEGEFMILEIQWEGKESNDIRKAGFNTWLEEIMTNEDNKYPKERFIHFKKNLTLGDVRGKILVIGCYDHGFVTENITNDLYKIPIATVRGGYIYDTYYGKDGPTGSNAIQIRDSYKQSYGDRGGDWELTQTEKKEKIKEGFLDWFKYFEDNDNNKDGQWNHISLNSYYYVTWCGSDEEYETASGICADDDDGEVIGTNHFTYDLLGAYSIPYGIVQFDFIGEERHDCDDCYGDKLLYRIINNNKRIDTGRFISDIMVFTCNNDDPDVMKGYINFEGYSIGEICHTNAGLDSNDGTWCPYVCFKTTNNPKEAISDVIVYDTGDTNTDGADTPPAELTLNGRTYHIAKAISKYDVHTAEVLKDNTHGDLNFKRGGDYLFIYYTKDPGPNLITSINVHTDNIHVLKSDEYHTSMYLDLEKEPIAADLNYNIANRADLAKNRVRLVLTKHEHRDYVYTDVFDAISLSKGEPNSTKHNIICSDCDLTIETADHIYDKKYKQENEYRHYIECTECKYRKYEECTRGDNTEDQHYELGFGKCMTCDGACYEQPEYSEDKSTVKISNPGQLFWYATQVNHNKLALKAELAADIDLSPLFENGKETKDSYHWTPIGVRGKSVDFDGRGHVISGLAYCQGLNGYDGINMGLLKPFGLFGALFNSNIRNFGLENSYFQGASNFGSVVGRLINVKMSNVYSTATFSLATSYLDDLNKVGALVLEADNSQIENCYYVGDYYQTNAIGAITKPVYQGSYTRVLGKNNDSVIKNCYAKKNDNNMEGVTVISGDDIESYNLVKWLNKNVKAHNNDNAGEWTYWRQSGNENTPTFLNIQMTLDNDNAAIIANADQLLTFSQYVVANPSADAKLTADIDFSKCEKKWQPIGMDEDFSFQGRFNGQGHVIKGIKRAAEDVLTLDGLFGATTNATIKNLGVDSCEFRGNHAGVFVGIANGTSVENCYSNSIAQSCIDGTVTREGDFFYLAKDKTSYIKNSFVRNNNSNIGLATDPGDCLTTDHVYTRYSKNDPYQYSESDYASGYLCAKLNQRVSSNNSNPTNVLFLKNYWNFWTQSLPDDTAPKFSNNASSESTDDKTTYHREMSNQWGTIVVPFPVDWDESNPFDLYKITSVSDSEIQLTKIAETLSAGTPVIIRMSEAAKNAETGKYELSLSKSYNYIENAISCPEVNGLKLIGSYIPKEITNEEGYICSNNAFWNIQGIKGENKVYNDPFHAYLAGTLTGGAQQITLKVIGGSFTLADVQAVADILLGKSEVTDVSRYDIDGKDGLTITDQTYIIKCLNDSDVITVTPGSSPTASNNGIKGE